MPRHTRSQGRPGTRVIPKNWSDTHSPVVAKTFGATIAARRPGGTLGPLDPETGTKPTVPYAPHFAGPARIEVLPRADQENLVAGMEVNTVGYRVSVGIDASIEPVGVTIVGCLIHVTGVDANGDQSLTGRDLTVVSLDRVSTRWERHLICTDNLDGGAPA